MDRLSAISNRTQLLKLDLYDKRMVVYEVVRKTLGVATGHGKLTQDEIDYLAGVRTAKWLFGSEVSTSTYLQETRWRKIISFSLHNTMSSSEDSAERGRYIEAVRRRLCG